MPQTTYGLTLTAAYEGMAKVERGGARSGRNNSGAEIPYGRIVVYDSGAGLSDMPISFKLPATSGDKILGGLMYEQAHEGTVTGVPDDAINSIVHQGKMWILTEQAVTPADPVFVRYDISGATGTSPALGKVRKDADTAKAVALTNAQFMSTAAAGALVEVMFNLP
jgi:hypothetical protein